MISLIVKCSILTCLAGAARIQKGKISQHLQEKVSTDCCYSEGQVVEYISETTGKLTNATVVSCRNDLVIIQSRNGHKGQKEFRCGDSRYTAVEDQEEAVVEETDDSICCGKYKVDDVVYYTSETTGKPTWASVKRCAPKDLVIIQSRNGKKNEKEFRCDDDRYSLTAPADALVEEVVMTAPPEDDIEDELEVSLMEDQLAQEVNGKSTCGGAGEVWLMKPDSGWGCYNKNNGVSQVYRKITVGFKTLKTPSSRAEFVIQVTCDNQKVRHPHDRGRIYTCKNGDSWGPYSIAGTFSCHDTFRVDIINTKKDYTLTGVGPAITWEKV